jgi:hypothetical protein
MMQLKIDLKNVKLEDELEARISSALKKNGKS